jgi:hypothetical protein
MSKMRIAPLALALTLAATSNAWADTGFSWNGSTVCGGNTFNTCAAVTVNVADGANGAATITITVTNLSGTNGTYAGTVFTQVGLDNLPQSGHPATSVIQYVDGTLVATDCGADGICGGANAADDKDVTSAWQLGTNGLSGAGIDPAVIGTDTKNGINGGFSAPTTYSFTFSVTSWSDSYLANAGFGIHGQGAGSCSTKLSITNTGGAETTGTALPADSCFSTTPEPITMALVGTGLAGMGGMGLIRRRKKSTDLA